jgi:signal transduction histidine kinase
MFWGLTLLAAALIINTVAGSFYTRKQIYQASSQLQKEMASLTARRIYYLITRKLERLQDAAVAMSLYLLGGEEQRLLSLLLLKNDLSFGELALLDMHGNEVLKFSERHVYLPSDLENQKTSPSFLTAIEGKTYLGAVYTSDRAEPYITLAVPLRSSPNTVIGVLVAQANLKFLWEAISESNFGHGGYAYVVNGQGDVIAHPDASQVLKRLNLKNLPKVSSFLKSGGEDPAPGQEGPGITGKPVLSTYAPVADLRWAVVVEEPLELALAGLMKLQRYAVLLVTLGLLLGAGIIVLVSRRITRPILELRRGVEKIRGGDLAYRTAIKTGDEIEELAEEFNEMTEALRNSYATLEQKVQQRTQEMAALYGVTTAVNKSLDVQTNLEAVIAKITEIFRFEATRVLLFNDQLDRLETRASFEANPEYWRGTRNFKRGEGVVGRVAESGEPLIFDDIDADPRYATFSVSKAAQSARRRFFAAFPIKTQSRIFGVITFNGETPRQLTGEEVRLLTSMCEHLGVAVEKASLFDQVQTRSRHLSVLNTIGNAVSQSLDLQKILKEALEKIAETLGFDASWIYLHEASAAELHLSAFHGLSEEMTRAMARRSVKMGVSGVVFETGERLVFEDVQTDGGYSKLSSTGKVQSLGFTTAAGFPIRAKEKIIGTLHVVNKKKRQFAPEELQLIESIAQEIGVAVDNARLFDEVNQKSAELVKLNQQLESANRAKSQFVAAMSHELRTPLNIMIGNADVTRDGLFGELNPEQANALEKISRYGRILMKMINDVLKLSRLDAKKNSLEVSSVAINDIIAYAKAHVEQVNRDHHLEVHWDIDNDMPTIVTDAMKLEEILQNLIGNAFKYTPSGRVEVRIRNLQELDRIEFSVADTGIGIGPSDLERIFDEFEQVNGSKTQVSSGVGLGLSIVKKYLDLMKGDIRVESAPGEGSTFVFSLPRSVSLDA